ncbi:Na(+)/H(+) antiporter [Cucumispora dikerogammari]|nr:Na(+)/H(+) antiporter [Cucumispora dikerogammari]
MIFGILIGPYCLNIVNTSYIESKILLYQFSRVVLCIQIMTVAMSLPHRYLFEQKKSLFFLIFVISWFKYLISFSIIYYFTNYNITICFAIAASLTPTDPVLSSSIVKSKFADENVPERLRYLVSAESGINDGIGLPFLYLPIHLSFSNSLQEGLLNFFIKTIFYECILSVLIGICIGFVARKTLKFCYSNNLVGTESFLVYGLALTFFCLGLMELIKSSELICIFFAGTAFSYDDWFAHETRESKLQEVTDEIFSTSFFIFFGSRINFSKLNYQNVLASLLIVFFRRLPGVLLFWRNIGAIKSIKEAVFVGWFGPIGVGALFYALKVDDLAFTLTIDFISVVVMFSTVIHGFTIPVFKLWCGNRDTKLLKEDNRLVVYRSRLTNRSTDLFQVVNI